MPEDLLLSFQPGGHLRILVVMVRRAICVLCEIDVEAFCVLGVVIVGCAKQLDGVDIVDQ